MSKKRARVEDRRSPTAVAPPAQQEHAPDTPLLRFLATHPYGVIITLFFLSGATGLVYQVVWLRRLTLTFGATVYAAGTVLAVFLGGLALGSLIFGRIADRRGDPVRLYALLEGAVGVLCFLTPWFFVAVEGAYVRMHPFIMHEQWLLLLVRFALAAGVLIVPTALMGGTLPVLSKALVHHEDLVGTGVARLYGINTLGAVLGAVAAGFVLIPAMGLKGTIFLAAVLNVGVAVVAYALHVVQQPVATQAEEPLPPALQMDAAVRRTYLSLLVAYGLSGAAALIYEVGWTRTLALAFGTTTYAFSAMLAAFLAGIGLGSLVLATNRRIGVDRLRTPLVWFGLIQVGIGASVTLLTPVLDRLPFAFLFLFERLGHRFWALQFAELAVALLVMLLPAALMGFAFPLVIRVATENLGVLGRRLGGVYAANTFGTVLGSVAAAFVLIPALGVRAALGVGVLLNVLVGVAYLVTLGRRSPRLATAGLALAGITGAAWWALPDWNRNVLISGAYIYPSYYLHQDARQRMEAPEILHYRDALTSTISVVRAPTDFMQKPLISLQINGKTDASTGDLSTQLLLAHLPALLHPEPRSALVVGLASGCTLGALTVYPELERIDCVEIEPEMLPVTELFREINRNCLDDPRVTVTIDDARSFMLVTPHRYDIITSEPSNPWISGVSNLFTREYFANSRDRLNPGGLFLQWIPVYNLAPQDLRTIVATFRDVFPHVTLWMFPEAPTDAFLVGTLDPLSMGVRVLAERAAGAEVAGDLERSGLHDKWDLLGGFLLGPGVIVGLAEGAARNTDDRPILEFSSPMTLHTTVPRSTMELLLQLGREARPPLTDLSYKQDGQTISALSNLTVQAPWAILGSEALHVTRNPSAYLAMAPGERSVGAAHMTAGHPSGMQVRAYAIRLGGPVVPPFPSRPEGAPDELHRVGEHQVSVYSAPAAGEGLHWAAFWHCPQNGRSYAVTAAADPTGPKPLSATEVLKSVRCLH